MKHRISLRCCCDEAVVGTACPQCAEAVLSRKQVTLTGITQRWTTGDAQLLANSQLVTEYLNDVHLLTETAGLFCFVNKVATIPGTKKFQFIFNNAPVYSNNLITVELVYGVRLNIGLVLDVFIDSVETNTASDTDQTVRWTLQPFSSQGKQNCNQSYNLTNAIRSIGGIDGFGRLVLTQSNAGTVVSA